MMTERELADAIRRKARSKFEDISEAQLNALAEAALAFGRSMKALDDQNYAEIRANSAARSGRSKRAIARKLSEKGVERSIVESVLQDADDLRSAVVYARKKAFGDVLPKIEKLHEAQAKTRDADAFLGEVLRMPTMVSSAITVVRMAEERAKADPVREPAFQERNWARIEQAERQAQKKIDRGIDAALLELALKRAAKMPAGQRPPVLAAVI